MVIPAVLELSGVGVRHRSVTAVLNSERTTKGPRGVVGLRTVVADEDSAVAAVAVEGTTKFSDVRGRFNPA